MTERLPTAIRQRSCRIGIADWSFGRTHFNLFFLGIVHNGVAFPIVWNYLDKKGNSNGEERMDLLDRFQKTFPHAQINYLGSDREFVGQQWLSDLLIEHKFGFDLEYAIVTK